MPLDPHQVNEAIDDAFPSAIAVRCVTLAPDHALVRCPIDPEGSRPGGFVPGPTQFALVDTALWYLTFGVVDRVELMALTADVDMTFLRPASGRMLWARADLLSAGSRKVVGTVRVWCDEAEDRPCAVAKGSYALPRS